MDRWTATEVLTRIDEYEHLGRLDPPIAEVARRYVERGDLDRALALIEGADAPEAEDAPEEKVDLEQ